MEAKKLSYSVEKGDRVVLERIYQRSYISFSVSQGSFTVALVILFELGEDRGE